LGIKISKDGNYVPERNDRVNKGRAAITKQTLICGTVKWPPKQTHIYHAIVKNTITYAAETWCLKAKTFQNCSQHKWIYGDPRLDFPGSTK
jgi:hypothetical protein